MKWPEMEDVARSWFELGKTSKVAMLSSSVPVKKLTACCTRIPYPDQLWVLEQWFDRLRHFVDGRFKNHEYCVEIATSLRNIKAAIPTNCEFFKLPGEDSRAHTVLHDATRVSKVAKHVRHHINDYD